MTRSAPPVPALTPSESRIVLIEDDGLLRDLLQRAIRERLSPGSLHAFASGQPGLDHLRQHGTDLLVVDLKLPDLDGRTLIRRLHADDTVPRMIVLTGQTDTNLPAELVALGVAGFVDKASSLDHALRAIERVLAGGMYFFAGVAPAASGMARHLPTASGPDPAVLSERERDVARLVAAGLSSKEIAQRLELSPRTVENYRANLLRKLGLRDTAALIRWCLQRGLG